MRHPLIAAFAVLAVPFALVSIRAVASEAAETPAFDAQPFSDDKTPPPESAEWTAAPDVVLDPGHALGSCVARRVREWVRLSCDGESFGAVRMLGGRRDGLQMKLTGDRDGFPGGVELVFPVRRGDARVIEVLTVDFGYHGSTSVSPWMVLSEGWPAEDDGPAISISVE